MTLGQSAVFIKTMTVTHIMAFEWPPMLLAVNAMLDGPDHLLGLLGKTPSCISLWPLSFW